LAQTVLNRSNSRIWGETSDEIEIGRSTFAAMMSRARRSCAGFM
jgi:hypothetical protein